MSVRSRVVLGRARRTCVLCRVVCRVPDVRFHFKPAEQWAVELWMPCGHIPYAMVCDLESSCKLFAASASILHGANGQPCISLSRTVKKKSPPAADCSGQPRWKHVDDFSIQTMVDETHDPRGKISIFFIAPKHCSQNFIHYACCNLYHFLFCSPAIVGQPNPDSKPNQPVHMSRLRL